MQFIGKLMVVVTFCSVHGIAFGESFKKISSGAKFDRAVDVINNILSIAECANLCTHRPECEGILYINNSCALIANITESNLSEPIADAVIYIRMGKW